MRSKEIKSVMCDVYMYTHIYCIFFIHTFNNFIIICFKQKIWFYFIITSHNCLFYILKLILYFRVYLDTWLSIVSVLLVYYQNHLMYIMACDNGPMYCISKKYNSTMTVPNKRILNNTMFLLFDLSLSLSLPACQRVCLGFDFWRYQIFWGEEGLEQGPLSLVSTIEEFLACRDSGLENRKYSHRDPSRWPRGTHYRQKLAPTSLTRGSTRKKETVQAELVKLFSKYITVLFYIVLQMHILQKAFF
jgi:hypothetical protein